MKIKILNYDKKGNKLSFVLSESSVAFANALRRAVIEEVPSLAIEDVEFRKNSSTLYDEIVAHRLGLIPLSTDLKAYNLATNCPCEGKGCAQCQLKLTIKEKGPKTVYASDIKSSDPNAKPVYPKMPIVTLLKGQNLEAEMTAILGTGRLHSKWCPGLVYYKYMPNITISKSGESCLECADICPKNVFDKKGKLTVNQKNLVECHLCGACEEKSKGQVSVDKDVKEFVFYVESWGQLSCQDIMIKAAECLETKFDNFNKSFGDTKK